MKGWVEISGRQDRSVAPHHPRHDHFLTTVELHYDIVEDTDPP
jgi:hypothetical protein